MVWDLLGNASTLATIETRVREGIANGKKRQNKKEINNIDVKLKEKMLDDIRNPIFEEALDEYVAAHASFFKAGNIFSDEEKEEFLDKFLNGHLDLMPYRETVREVLRYYFDELEKHISQIMSDGEFLIYKETRKIGQDLKGVSGKIDGMLQEGQVNKVKTVAVFTANQMYCRSFLEPLFLHKNEENTKVSLKNLFIFPKYYLIEGRGISEKREDFIEFLGEFLRREKESFLFIEGDAGCGKSSLVSFLNYHFEEQDRLGKEIFQGKKLITVRLRDMPINKMSETEHFERSILSYLNVKSIQELEGIYPNAVLLLDGFDELCMVENMGARVEKCIYDLRKFHRYKIIMTTRPKYINFRHLNVISVHILLEHLDQEQRGQWLEKYEVVCKQIVDREKRDFLNRISEEDAFGICDTPMALYMLVAGKIGQKALYNEWALYHQIFYNELSETEYNQMYPNENYDYEHGIIEYRESIYQISEEIAYKMYCNKNSKLYLMNDEVGEIIEKAGLADGLAKSVIERCYALCGYWKADAEKGMVEFYHNNMRDFFLCEKIIRKMNEIYELWCVRQKYDLHDVIQELCKLFQYGELETMVCKFILLRTMYKCECGELDELFELENKYRKLPELMQSLLTSGDLYIFSHDRNPVDTVCSVLSCVVQVYRHIYEPMLKEEERIRWWNRADIISESGMLKHLFKFIFIKVPVTLQYDSSLSLSSRGDFSFLDLRGCDMRNAGFSGSSLRDTELEDAILKGCDFEWADVGNADFTNAILEYASFKGANLQGCIFKGSEMSNCDFTDARLEDAVLPDGYSSKQQTQQMEHMLELGVIV